MASVSKAEHSSNKKGAGDLAGIWAGLPTPFNNDWSIDEKSLAENIRRMIKVGAHGIYLLGSTGEFYAMDFDEFKAVVEILVSEASASGIPLAVVCASPATRDTLRQVEYVAERGCHAAQLVLPYWMELTERELLQFYRDVARAAPKLSIIHYNIPRAKRFLLASDYVQMRKHLPNLKASKFTFAASHFGDLVDAIVANPSMKFLVGETLLVSAMQLGAHGSCSSLIYTNAHFMLKMYNLACDGKWEEALAMQGKLALFSTGLDQLLANLHEGGIDPVADKGLGVAAGGITGHQRTRAPYIGWSDATVKAVRKWMTKHYPELLASA